MKRLLIILLSLAVTLPISARMVLCEDNCKVEFTEGTESEPRFAFSLCTLDRKSVV